MLLTTKAKLSAANEASIRASEVEAAAPAADEMLDESIIVKNVASKK
jgi:hypothetical protein